MSDRIPFPMKPAGRLLQVLVLLLLAGGAVHAQWVQLGTPGFLTCALKTSSRILAGSAMGSVFSSSDNGVTWNDASIGLSGNDVSGLASIGQNIFASTRGGGVFVSTNQGGSWSPVNTFLISTDIGSLAAIGGVLFAGPVGYGAFYSTDNGSMWLPAGKGIGTETVNVFFSINTTLYAGTTRGMYLSVDGGKNWSPLLTGLPPSGNVIAFASIGPLLFAGVYPGGVFASADNGASWSPAGLGIGVNRITSLVSVPIPQSGSWKLLAGTATGGLFASIDSGESWTKTDLGVSSDRVGALTAEGSNVYATLGEGVRISSDAGQHWGGAGTGLPTNLVTAFGFVGTSLFIGTSRRGVLTSIDGGGSWTSLNQQLSNLEISSMAVSGTKVYVGTTGGSVFRRDTSDQAWIRGGNALANLPIQAMGCSGALVFAAAGLRGIFYSPDEGENWLGAQGSVVDVKGTEFTSFAVRQGYAFGGSVNAGVFRSTDNAITWMQKNAGLGNLTIRAIVLNGSTLYAGTAAGVYRSNDNGDAWQATGTSLSGHTVTGLAASGSMIVAGTAGTGVFVSTDQGDTWRGANQGLPVTTVGVLASDGTNVYAGNGLGGTYSRRVSELVSSLTDVAHSPARPSASRLLQNYPNPFNPETKIGYRVSGLGSSWVKLAVYDVLGREVAVLVDERKEPGIYEVRFDARGLSSGTYFCRMTADHSVDAMRLLIVR